jgi:hypothetical protein
VIRSAGDDAGPRVSAADGLERAKVVEVVAMPRVPAAAIPTLP